MAITFYFLAGLGLILSAFKSREKTLAALKKAWKAVENILPQLLSILLIIGVMLAVLSPEQISKLLGAKTGMLGVLVAAAVGSVTLVPAFVAFPLAAALLNGGAGIMQIAAFVSTLMMVGVVTLPLEIKYFGRKAAFLRNGLALLFSFGVAFAMGKLI